MRIERLAELYAEKTDEELVQLAARANDLVDDALTALRSEAARRRIQAPAKSTPERTHEVRPVPVMVPAGTSVADL